MIKKRKKRKKIPNKHFTPKFISHTHTQKKSCWGHLDDVITKGRSCYRDYNNGLDFWEDCAKNPAYQKAFDGAMSMNSLHDSSSFLSAFKIPESMATVVDIGGGEGV